MTSTTMLETLDQSVSTATAFLRTVSTSIPLALKDSTTNNLYLLPASNHLWEYVILFASPIIALASLVYTMRVHRFALRLQRPIIKSGESKVAVVTSDKTENHRFRYTVVVVFENVGKHPAENLMIAVAVDAVIPTKTRIGERVFKSANVFHVGNPLQWSYEFETEQAIEDPRRVYFTFETNYRDSLSKKQYQEKGYYYYNDTKPMLLHLSVEERQALESKK